ncbi:MAG: hypothetical protein ACR2LX_00740 [Jatrophihabitans sp.]
MTGIVILVVVLVALALAGLAVVLGFAPDTRDPEYSVGAMIAWRNEGR